MKFAKMERNYLVLLALLMLFACNRKEEEFTLADGVVTDAATGKPIPFATVEVRSEQGAFCLWCPEDRYKTIVFEKQADQNGRFSFGFAANENLRYAISARTDRYYSLKNANVYITKNKANKNLTVSLYSYAWLKLVVKNEFPTDTADININPKIQSDIHLSNISSDTTILTRTEHFGNILLEYSINKPGNYITMQDSVQLIQGDTVTFEIKY
jgi:hypothetical protein